MYIITIFDILDTYKYIISSGIKLNKSSFLSVLRDIIFHCQLPIDIVLDLEKINHKYDDVSVILKKEIYDYLVILSDYIMSKYKANKIDVVDYRIYPYRLVLEIKLL